MPALRTRDTQSRTLEVSTDAPAAPSLHIVSPTPRAFTFSTPHNLTDSPYASPSSSPFEPDLRSFPQPCTLSSSSSSMIATPPPHSYAVLRADSPFARAPSPPTPAHNHKRRKSSCSSDVVERRPKKGDEDYIKRPENAFILFRRKCCEDRQQAQEEAANADGGAGAGPTKKQRQADLSKTISQQWKSLSPEERQFWEQLAKDKKKEHESKYPNYVYRPQRAKDKDGKTKSNSKKASSASSTAAAASAAAAQAQAEAASKAMGYDESESVSFVVPVSRPHGRSASAPTPPPYQSIQIPNVYHLTPSCPTSPSLLPMISRRSAHPGHPEDAMTTFDFVPTNQSAYLPSSYPMPGQFEASLQSSEFLRSIFNNPNTPANGHRNSEPATHLQHLNMSHQQQQPDTLLLPAHHIVSPASSIGSGSGSSGPSSPSSGPYTPTSALLSSSSSSSWHHGHHMDAACDPTSLEAQAQAEMDLQMEMQVQQEFAAFSWGGGPNALWGTGEPAVLMGDDFDINAIPPIELPLTKYTENLALGAGPDGSGLEFGQDFACALDAGSQYHHHYNDGSQGTGGLLFDDMMAGHGF